MTSFRDFIPVFATLDAETVDGVVILNISSGLATIRCMHFGWSVLFRLALNITKIAAKKADTGGLLLQ